MSYPDANQCPEHLQASLRRYADDRIETGGFLRAVLENNLKEAIGRADHINIWILPHIVAYCYNKIPRACWGSPEKVSAWLAEGRGA